MAKNDNKGAKVETPSPEPTTAPEVNAAQGQTSETTPTPEPAKVEPTSPLLVQLKGKEEGLDEKIGAAYAAKDKDGARKLMMELWEVQKSIENEKAAIAKREKDLEIEAAKNARLALNEAQFPLYVAHLKAEEAFNAIPAEQRTKEDIDTANAAYNAFKTAKEKVDNELLSRYGSTSTAKKTGDGTTGAKGKTAEVIELIKPMYAEGKTGSEVRAAIKMYGGNGAWGYFNDGTANAAILAYEKENRLNGKSPD